MKFISKDGFLDVAELTTFARTIDKFAVKQGLRTTNIWFSPRLIPKYDVDRAKIGGELYARKRAKVLKNKTRMPALGTRVMMQILLKNYKGLEDTATYKEEFAKDFKAAVAAIEAHNKAAEKFIAKFKEAAAKKREKVNAEFDKNIDEAVNVLTAGGVSKKYIVIGTSMLGKTVLVKLPNGGYISVGKADKERFDKAREKAEAPAAPAKEKADAPKKATVTNIADKRKSSSSRSGKPPAKKPAKKAA